MLTALVTFIFHTKVFHQPLDAVTAFTALAFFNVIRNPLDQLADQMSQLLATIVSASRVDSLLNEEETAKYAIVSEPQNAADPKIGFVNAALTWGDAATALLDDNVFKLQNLNLSFTLDGLSLIAGPVGSVSTSQPLLRWLRTRFAGQKQHATSTAGRDESPRWPLLPPVPNSPRDRQGSVHPHRHSRLLCPNAMASE